MQKQRSSNLELLRIISMFLIVMHHYAVHGGFQLLEKDLSLNKIIIQILSGGGQLGVNLFILISGYFLIDSEFKINKLLKLIFETFFYSVIILLFIVSKSNLNIGIKDIIDTGILIDADVSPQLLTNIFVPKTPLHDGAVVISHNKIKAAACMLPLASDQDIAKELGTRHRAGIGISKESDAIVVIVSEETGKISIAKDGNLLEDVTEEMLKKILIKNIVTDRIPEKEIKNNIFWKKLKDNKNNIKK